jgi:energy-coupling factor transporter ATP-binding protein EcfA2
VGDEIAKAETISSPHISRIEITDLFGTYSYDLILGNPTLAKTAIFYGENGLGKTNLLRILFHTLSPANNRGHRTALSKIKFHRVRIHLSNDIILQATRAEGALDGRTMHQISRVVTVQAKSKTANKKNELSEQVLAIWEHVPKSEQGSQDHMRMQKQLELLAMQKASGGKQSKEFQEKLKSFTDLLAYANSENEEKYASALRENTPSCFFLSADRILSSDQLEESYSATSQIPPTVDMMRPEEMIRRGREQALKQAIRAAEQKFTQTAVTSARRGTASVHGIYQTVLLQLGKKRTKASTNESNSIKPSLISHLKVLSDKYAKFAEYALATPLANDDLIKALESLTKPKVAVAASILEPYVNSLTTQAEQTEVMYQFIDTFVKTVNNFLEDKEIRFKMFDGLQVVSKGKNEVLSTSDLSSGEQQLLLLFCYVIIASDTNGIFIVDEPEISLNIKWQRLLVDALSTLNRNGRLQFVLASHSMELLAKHRNCVLPLENIGSHGIRNPKTVD